MTVLHGKGVWAVEAEDVKEAIRQAPQMAKVGDTPKFDDGVRRTVYYDHAASACQQILDAGLTPMAWIFVRMLHPEEEAQLISRAFADGYQGVILDVEDECAGKQDAAQRLVDYALARGVDPYRVYNCSFPNIYGHDDLPYETLNALCKGGMMPMSYATFYLSDTDVAPADQAREVIDEWTYTQYERFYGPLGYKPPMYPALGPFHEQPELRLLTATEFQPWLDRLAAHRPTFFSLYAIHTIHPSLYPLISAYPLAESSTPEPGGVQVKVVSLELGYLRIRPTPSTDQLPTAKVDHGTTLESLEPEQETARKVGQPGQWLHIRTPAGDEGYAAAWYLRLPGESQDENETADATVQVEVVSQEVGFLRIRPTPSTEQPATGQVDHGAVLDSLEPEPDTRAKVGRDGQWLHIRTAGGVEGYVAAWHLRFPGEEEDEDIITGRPVPHVVVHSSIGLNVRPDPGTDKDPIWHVVDRTVLKVREDPNKVGGKLGKDRWLKVQTPSLHEGYVNGLYVQAQEEDDERTPVDDGVLPRGECAWIFGIHAADSPTADFRSLFEGKGKTGWMLTTQEVRARPNHDHGHDYTSWSDNGYGVIVRINYGYETNGTLPMHTEYGNFAQACARYVENSSGCHIWIIGNEQNNPREHPGGAEHPTEHITPARYAEAFNLARRRIKQVQPEAIVVPGAVDPYYGLAWKLTGERYRPLDYFKEMLSHIDDLDGIALHTYTHWLEVGLITKPTTFDDPFLQPGTPKEHYYDFLAYRSFAEAIPARWRDRPIYITESNHWLALEHPPHNKEEASRAGWVNVDKGWVQAAYAEIDRWNNTPHAQQIHCLLLYRWTGDAWIIRDKSEIKKDFRKALDHDYRWRR